MKCDLLSCRKSPFVMLFGLLLLASCTPTSPWGVGPEEVLMARADCQSLGLYAFPDGFSGIRWDSDEAQVHFWAANSGVTAHLVGTLDTPDLHSVTPAIQLQNPKGNYDYASGGMVFTDPGSGMILLFYHAERHPVSYFNFLSSLGLAYSMDGGQSFTDLGEYILSPVSMAEAAAAEATIPMSGGSPIIMGDYFYCYYDDITTLFGIGGSLAVARAPVADVVEAALEGELAPWFKYYNGSWTEPGNIDGDRGGLFTPLSLVGQCPSATYNQYLNKVVIVSSAWSTPFSGDTVVLQSISSPDGISFSSPEILVETLGNELFYPTIVPIEADLTSTGNPLQTGQSFWLYYTNSAVGGWDRWFDAAWARRLITPLL